MKKIFEVLQNESTSTAILTKKTGFSRTKILNLLKKMIAEGYVVKFGQGRGPKYGLAKVRL